MNNKYKESWTIYKIVNSNPTIKSAKTTFNLEVFEAGFSTPTKAENRLDELINQHQADTFTILPIYCYTNG